MVQTGFVTIGSALSWRVADVIRPVADALPSLSRRASGTLASAGRASEGLVRGFIQGSDQFLVPFDFEPRMVQWFTLINRTGAPIGVGYQLSERHSWHMNAGHMALWARGLEAPGVIATVDGDFSRFRINGYGPADAGVPINKLAVTPWPALSGIRGPGLKTTAYVLAEGTQGMLAFSVLDKTGRATTAWTLPDGAAQIIASNPQLQRLLGQEDHLAVLAPFAGFGGPQSPAGAVASALHHDGLAVTVHGSRTYLSRFLHVISDEALPEGWAADPSVVQRLMNQSGVTLKPGLVLDAESPYGVLYCEGGRFATFAPPHRGRSA